MVALNSKTTNELLFLCLEPNEYGNLQKLKLCTTIMLGASQCAYFVLNGGSAFCEPRVNRLLYSSPAVQSEKRRAGKNIYFCSFNTKTINRIYNQEEKVMKKKKQKMIVRILQ